MIETYRGPMSCSKSVKMPREARRAYYIYRNQINKCRNPKLREYKYYGGKGIRVEYSPREFISWWLHHVKQKKWTRPTVGRIDHDKNYSFDNIEMQELRDNVIESWDRLGRKTHPHVVNWRRKVEVTLNGVVHVYDSAKTAAKFLKMDSGHVSRLARGIYTPKNKNLSVRYME